MSGSRRLDTIFGRPFVKRFTLYAIVPLSCLSCLSVCDVGVLWPNGGMDQDETWHAGRPRPWPHDGDPAPQFSAHVHCGQTAGWIKTALGTEVGLGLGHIVLDGNPSPLPKTLSIFGPFLL